MKYEIIYYHCGRTSEIEHELKGCLSAAGMELQYACAAADPKELVKKLTASLKRAGLVIIAAAEEKGNSGAGVVLEKTLMPKKGSRTIKLPSDSDDGYFAEIYESGGQAVVLYCAEADNCGGIKEMRERLAGFFGVEISGEECEDTEKIMEQLDDQMKTVSRVRIAVEGGMTAEKRHKESLKKIRISIAVLLSLAAVLLGAAAWLFISYM